MNEHLSTVNNTGSVSNVASVSNASSGSNAGNASLNDLADRMIDKMTQHGLIFAPPPSGDRTQV